MFKEFDAASEDGNNAMRRPLVAQICDALTVHAQIEEEIFDPALRRASKEAADMLNGAAVEHQSLKDIVGRLQKVPTRDPLYDAGVKVLGEYVNHHVREEESEIFPSAPAAAASRRPAGSCAYRFVFREGWMPGTGPSALRGPDAT